MENQTLKGLIHAIGVMSGTSMDGIDVVRVTSDGENRCVVKGHFYRPYPAALRDDLRKLAQGDMPLADVMRIEQRLTREYASAVLESDLLDGAQVVGCHGQTIRHLPQEGLTWQMGDANLLAEKVGVPVVMDFRRRDMAAGGEGAPLAPLFHTVMLTGKPLPAAVLNLGGVANISVVMADGNVLASDTGPGVGLIDSLMRKRTASQFDRDGALTLSGTVDKAMVERALKNTPFWQRKVPRSADRYEFNSILDDMSSFTDASAAATLGAITVGGVVRTLADMGLEPAQLKGLYVAGGGALNKGLVHGLETAGFQVRDLVQATGLQPQTVEASCFAWLAVRRLRGLTTTLPTTTGCKKPTVGGVLTA